MKYKSRFLGIIILYLVVLPLCFMLSTNIFVFGSSNIGNVSSSLTSSYSFNDNLAGWINISLSNEPFNSLLTASYTPAANENNISIKDLLAKNPNILSSCTTVNCGMTYDASDAGTSSRTFTLNSGESVLLGMLVNDSLEVMDVTGFSLNVTSSASDNCASQLRLDINNDGIYEWSANRQELNSFCSKSYGCYTTPKDTLTIANQDYCETINISSASALFIGANVTGVGTANFTFSVNGQVCSAGTSQSGEIGCPINMTITEPTSLNVCMRETSGNYQIYYEDTNPCGSSGGAFLDFSIFAQPVKFDSVGNVLINSSDIGVNLGRYVDTYILNISNRDCTYGCYIPLKFLSSQDGQQVTINNAQIAYTTSAGGKQATSLYSLVQTTSKINMPFKLLFLNNSGLKVPGTAGAYNLTLKLGGSTLLSKSIVVTSAPMIDTVYPSQAPAGANIRFNVLASGANITSYKWSFGDNSSIVSTSVPYASHTYNSLSNYTLVVTVQNNQGNTSKAFPIMVISPKDYLNSSLIAYRNKINNLNGQIASLPDLAKGYISGALNLSGTDSEVAGLQVQFSSAGNDTLTQISILGELANINLPDAINITEKASGNFIMDSSKISLADLYKIVSETASADESTVKGAIFDWFLNSLNVNAHVDVYSSIYSNSTTPLASYITLTIAPKTPLNKIYAVINEPRDNVVLSSSLSSTAISSGNTLGLPLDFSGSTNAMNLNFLLKERVGLLELPIYFSPLLSELSLVTNVSSCNYNGKCESGENSTNCRADCPAWGTAIMWIIISLIIVFCLYIAAQEWYKKKYESYLFKDKNDLFNLINFMDNAEKQALKKEEIFGKLKEKMWHGEQIEYAYRKFKGMRTGMWEIPVLKFLENKKVAQELEIRKKMGVSPNIVPKPIRPFFGKSIAKPLSTVQTQEQQIPTQQKPLQEAIKQASDQQKQNMRASPDNKQVDKKQ